MQIRERLSQCCDVSLTEVRFNFECPVYLLPEVDGLRIIGNDMHEFLQRVPSRPKPLLQTRPPFIFVSFLAHMCYTICISALVLLALSVSLHLLLRGTWDCIAVLQGQALLSQRYLFLAPSGLFHVCVCVCVCVRVCVCVCKVRWNEFQI